MSKQTDTDSNQYSLTVNTEDKLLNYLIDAAESGVFEAQCELALEYLKGTRVEKDINKAIDLLIKSQNYHKSAYELGVLLLEGKVISQNIQKAKILLQNASQNGNLDASLQLGIMHKEAKESDQAIDYFLKIVDQSTNTNWDKQKIAYAHFLLAEVYLEYKKDFIRAQKYLLRVYETYNDVKAANLLGKLFFDNKYVEKDYNLACKYLNFASERDNAESTFLLSRLYIQGLGNIKKDINKGLALLEKSAHLGFIDARYELAKLYLDKDFERYDEYQGNLLLVNLSNEGHVDAQLMLASRSFERGANQEGFKWAEKAAESNNVAAYLYLGLKILENCKLSSELSYWDMITFGLFNAEKYCSAGMKWIEEAADRFNNDEALVLLIEAYMTGIYRNKKIVTIDALKATHYIANAELQKLPISYYYFAKLMLDNPASSNKQIEAAKDKLLRAVDSANLDAMFYYGNLLIKGTHFPQNTHEGVSILINAANNGHYESQYTLGTLFYKEEWAKNCPKAIAWLLKSIYHPYNPNIMLMQELADKYNIQVDIQDENSFKNAYHQISLKIHPDTNKILLTKFTEIELSSDFEKLRLLYKGQYNNDKLPEAIYDLHTDAEFFIGEMYYNGCFGLEKDLFKAKAWYQIAADKDHKEAKFQLYLVSQKIGGLQLKLRDDYADEVVDDDITRSDENKELDINHLDYHSNEHHHEL